MDTLHIVQ